MALSNVSVASCSSSFDCTRELFDPKIKASIICSSVLVNLHSLTSTRTCLRKESTVSSFPCLIVHNLNLANLKLLFGAT